MEKAYTEKNGAATIFICKGLTFYVERSIYTSLGLGIRNSYAEIHDNQSRRSAVIKRQT